VRCLPPRNHRAVTLTARGTSELEGCIPSTTPGGGCRGPRPSLTRVHGPFYALCMSCAAATQTHRRSSSPSTRPTPPVVRGRSRVHPSAGWLSAQKRRRGYSDEKVANRDTKVWHGATEKGPLNDGRVQNPSNPFGIVPLSNFVLRGFGFVHHSKPFSITKCQTLIPRFATF
jgi:hypothetical protein